jgi:hypothetical protein
VENKMPESPITQNASLSTAVKKRHISNLPQYIPKANQIHTAIAVFIKGPLQNVSYFSQENSLVCEHKQEHVDLTRK